MVQTFVYFLIGLCHGFVRLRNCLVEPLHGPLADQNVLFVNVSVFPPNVEDKED